MSSILVVCKDCGHTYRHQHSGSKDYGPPPHSNCPAKKETRVKRSYELEWWRDHG